jgi:hypothetical protein
MSNQNSSVAVGCVGIVLALLTNLTAFVAISPEGPVSWQTGVCITSAMGFCTLALVSAAFLKSNRGDQARAQATVVIVLLVLAVLQTGFWSAVYHARTAASRTMSINNIKQIALSLRNFESKHHAFPPHAIYSPDGKPLISWRVALLRLIEQEALYQQFNLDESWDSPHNIKLLDKMPPTYSTPGQESTSLTHYQVFYGPGAAFEGKQGTKLTDFPDSLGQTILLIEAAEPVPWTKPQDLSFDPGQPLPKIGGLFQSGANAAFADASVRVIPTNVSEATLRALITRNAGDKPGNDWGPD